ncbi:MAG: response regulator transcription factor [Bacteroidota bacterium]|nr:response regulator transcription factor [Bacteroidota bacterium]
MRVLLVEDDTKISSALARGLKTEAYAVDVAGDGKTGEELAKINEYDIIILDIMLPKQDGWETCTKLRKDNITTPILMLTALDDVSDRIKGLDTGADDYLPKPFHFRELLARIRALTRRRTESRSAVLELFGVTLDVNTHTAQRDGKTIRLSAKEFALLELFIMNPNKILSRETISEHVWDMNFDPHSNVIEAFVKFLRQKIDKDFPTRLIRTVRGSGYIFTDNKE